MLRYLADTNAVIRRLTAPGKLSREQNRILDLLEQRNEPFAISAISLVELAILHGTGEARIRGGTLRILRELDTSPAWQLLPVTIRIVEEIAEVGDALRDPADRTIVATARVHRLKLITSDERIAASGLVSVVE